MNSAGVWLLSVSWSAVNRVARKLAEILPGYAVDLGVRTISVGNVQAGGSGKTPIVRSVAQECIDRGLRVCILSRGFGGTWESDPHAMSPSESVQEAAAPRECGDEVALLRGFLPKAWFGVGADRVEAFRLAQRSLQAGEKFDCVILDDGLQHWKIRRHLDLIAVTSDLPHERVFRESLRRNVNDRLNARDLPTLWIWTKGKNDPLAEVSSREVFKKSVCKVRYHLNLPESLTKGEKVWSVCGIADPRRFHESIAELGLKIDRQLEFKDHHPYQSVELEEIFAAAKLAGAHLVTTGKDSVKWKALGFTDFFTVEPVLKWELGRENWENVLWR